MDVRSGEPDEGFHCLAGLYPIIGLEGVECNPVFAIAVKLRGVSGSKWPVSPTLVGSKEDEINFNMVL